MALISSKNTFVFVVCGENKHIETLHFSIKYLRYFSKNPIIVVTDKKRNSIKIDHDFIIDVETPIHYDHHQASIWLKTGLYHILPPANNYCYLDTDVIALGNEVDEVFNYFSAPITFAIDHCTLNFFSAAAVHCSCTQKYDDRKRRFAEMLNSIIPEYNYDKDFNNTYTRIVAGKIEAALKSPFKNIFFLLKLYLRRVLPNSLSPRIASDIIYSREKKAWVNKKGEKIAHVIMDYYSNIKNQSKFRYNRFRSKWHEKGEGEVFDSSGCKHLIETIQEKFQIAIHDSKWQHWNGGVFLFNDSSREFLDSWHKMTIEIFNDKFWKTRDQGTLVAAVWKYALQNHRCLDEKFNFLADFNNNGITTSNDKDRLIAFKGNKLIYPAFIHVYHHFGNKEWDIWIAIEEILEKKITFDCNN